jgi:hypothetical protein
MYVINAVGSRRYASFKLKNLNGSRLYASFELKDSTL